MRSSTVRCACRATLISSSSLQRSEDGMLPCPPTGGTRTDFASRYRYPSATRLPSTVHVDSHRLAQPAPPLSPSLHASMSAAPVPSTSVAAADSPEASTSRATLGKRKRLPACDCCKMRRLKCEPVPPPGSCPRCKATGVVCTTTPTVRKKAVGRTGKRIEEAK